MTTSYRGHEITVTREPSLAGEVLLFYAVFRESDQYECTSGYSYGDETVPQYTRILMQEIDEELLQDDPWDEQAESQLDELKGKE